MTIVTLVGTLKLGEALADEALKVGDLERFARLDHDVAGEFLAEAFVGDAVHGGFVDGRVLVDRRLDLGAVDVLTAAQDHVLGAVADVHEPLVVDAADVARAQPARRRSCRRWPRDGSSSRG